MRRDDDENGWDDEEQERAERRRRRRDEDDQPRRAGRVAYAVLGWVALGIGALMLPIGFATDNVFQATYWAAVACFLGIAARMLQAQGIACGVARDRRRRDDD